MENPRFRALAPVAFFLLGCLLACGDPRVGAASLEIRVRIPVDLPQAAGRGIDGGKLIHPLTRLVRAEISGPGFGPIADEATRGPAQTEVSLRLQDVPTGPGRELVVTTYDADGLLLTGSRRTVEVVYGQSSLAPVVLQAAVDAAIGLGTDQTLPAVPADTVGFARFTLGAGGAPVRVRVQDAGGLDVAGVRFYYANASSVAAALDAGTGDYLFTPAAAGEYSALVPGSAATAAGALHLRVSGDASCAPTGLFEGTQPKREKICFAFSQAMDPASLSLGAGFVGSPYGSWSDGNRRLEVFDAVPTAGTVDFSFAAKDALTGADHNFVVREQVVNYIFVAATGEPVADGTLANPSTMACYTASGIAARGGLPCTFIVGTGTYSVASLPLVDGAQIWGGYAPATWTHAEGSRSVLLATDVDAASSFTATGATVLAFRGLSFRRAPKTTATASSGRTDRAVLGLVDCNLEMEDCEVVLQDLVTLGNNPMSASGAPLNVVYGIDASALGNGRRIAIDRCRITGGKFSNQANIVLASGYGIRCSSSASDATLVLSNSVVDPLIVPRNQYYIEEFYGVHANGLRCYIVGNTIMEGYGFSYFSCGLALLNRPDSVLVNNLFLPLAFQSNRGYHIDANGHVAVFLNNYLGLIKYVPSGNYVEFMHWTLDSTLYSPSTAAELDDSAGFGSLAGGNVAVQFNPGSADDEPLLPYLQKIFFDPDGAADDIMVPLGRDFRPAASSSGLVAGGDVFRAGGRSLGAGADLSVLLPGLDPAYYARLLLDYSGASRSAASWSIGAYQYP